MAKLKKKRRRDPEARLRSLENSVHSLETIVGLDDERYPLPEEAEALSVLELVALDVGIPVKYAPAFGEWLRKEFYKDQGTVL